MGRCQLLSVNHDCISNQAVHSQMHEAIGEQIGRRRFFEGRMAIVLTSTSQAKTTLGYVALRFPTVVS